MVFGHKPERCYGAKRSPQTSKVVDHPQVLLRDLFDHRRKALSELY